jgi:hypothetical protein
MHWSHFAGIIDAKHNEVFKAGNRALMEDRLPHPTPFNELISQELVRRRTVDMALRYWVAKRHFAVVSPEIANYMAIRFTSASQFLHSMSRLNPTFDATERRVLTWLLVDHWRLAGRAEWLQYNFGKNWPAPKPSAKRKA